MVASNCAGGGNVSRARSEFCVMLNIFTRTDLNGLGDEGYSSFLTFNDVCHRAENEWLHDASAGGSPLLE